MSGVPPYLPPLFALAATIVSGICSFGDGIAFLLLWSIFSAFGVIKTTADTYPTAVLYVSLLPLCSLPSLLWAARKEVKASFGYAVALSISTAAFIPLGSNFLLTGSVETLKLIIGCFFLVFAVFSLWIAAYGDGKEAVEEAKKNGGQRKPLCTCFSKKDRVDDVTAEGGKGERVGLLSGAVIRGPSYSSGNTKTTVATTITAPTAPPATVPAGHPLLLLSARGTVPTATIAEEGGDGTDDGERAYSQESPAGDLGEGSLMIDERAFLSQQRAFSTESAPSASLSMQLHRLRQQSTDSGGAPSASLLTAGALRAGGRRGSRASMLFELAAKGAKGMASGAKKAARQARKISVLDGVPIDLSPTPDPTAVPGSNSSGGDASAGAGEGGPAASSDSTASSSLVLVTTLDPQPTAATTTARTIKRERSRSLDLGNRAQRAATLLSPSPSRSTKNATHSTAADDSDHSALDVAAEGSSGNDGYNSLPAADGGKSASVLIAATGGKITSVSSSASDEGADLIDCCSCPCLYRCCPGFSDRLTACLLPFFPVASKRCSRRSTAIVLFFTGFASGLLGGLIGTGGPPQLVAFSSLQLKKEQIRGVKVLATLVSNSLRIALFIAWGQGELFKEKWWVYLTVTIASLVGATIGSWAREYVQGETILRLLYVLLFLSTAELFGVFGGEGKDAASDPINPLVVAGFVGGFILWLFTVYYCWSYPGAVGAMMKRSKGLVCCFPCCKR
jgi:uncharacterized membrane protein YfcA